MKTTGNNDREVVNTTPILSMDLRRHDQDHCFTVIVLRRIKYAFGPFTGRPSEVTGLILKNQKVKISLYSFKQQF